MAWDSTTGFPELISPFWWCKKYIEGPNPSRRIRCKVQKFILIYRQWNGEVRVQVEYKTEFFNVHSNKWTECF